MPTGKEILVWAEKKKKKRKKARKTKIKCTKQLSSFTLLNKWILVFRSPYLLSEHNQLSSKVITLHHCQPVRAIQLQS